MKNLSLLLLLVMCGCLQKAQSLNPFYTPDLRTDLPAIRGEWDEVATSRADGAIRVIVDLTTGDRRRKFVK